jgi:hypothetical protein
MKNWLRDGLPLPQSDKPSRSRWEAAILFPMRIRFPPPGILRKICIGPVVDGARADQERNGKLDKDRRSVLQPSGY